MRNLFLSRAALITSCLLFFIGIVIGMCGANSLICLLVIATDGFVAAAWILSASALGWVLLRNLRCDANGSLQFATAGGLGLGIYSLLGLCLGLLGWLNRPVAISLPLISLLVFVIDLLRRSPSGAKIDAAGFTRWLLAPAGASWIWLVPVGSLALACIAASVLPGVLWKPLDPHPYDVTSYHLLVPREWYEGGRIVPLNHNVFSYFPFNVEMQFLLLMHATGGPWAAMYACQFVNVGYALLMVLAVGGKGERPTLNVQHSTFNERGGPTPSFKRWTAASELPVIGGAIMAVVPWTIMLAGVAYVESGLMLYTALAIAWALRAIGHPQRLLRLLILSGIMAGFACGVKITAVPMLLLSLPVGVAVVTRFERRAVIGCVALLLAGCLILSPWLIRNFVWTGNPLFPIAMKTLGRGHFSTAQVERFITAHSPTISQQPFWAKLRVLWNDVLTGWEYGIVILPGALTALLLGRRERETKLLAIVAVFVLVVWIGFTHLLPRFLVMLIPIAGIVISRIQWKSAWPIGLAMVSLAAGLGWTSVANELYKQSNPAPVDGQPRAALFGLEDTSFMYQNAAELIDAHDRKLDVGLVGDAQAFLYQIPMSHLHYRTVFDIGPGDPIDAWVGAQAKGNPDWLLVINPTEIDRLHRTYVDVPPLPPSWAARGPQPFFFHGNELQER